MKCLCLVDDLENYNIVDRNIDISPIYKKKSKFMRILRYLHHQLPVLSKWKNHWLGDWKKSISQYDHIIVFDTIFDYYPLDYIRKYNKYCKLIFCYRNRVTAPITHSKLIKSPTLIRNKYSAELLSYNKDDCYKYNMTYYNQFHTIPKVYIDYHFDIETDLYFIGKDKGRLSILNDLSEVLNQKDIRYKFQVIPDKHKKYTNQDKKFLHSPIKYSDVIENSYKSRCILELVGSSNRGITYRVLESIILKRKLVTNNIDLVNEDIFDKDNMFILGLHDIDSLSEFIKNPYKDNQNNKNIFSFQEFCRNILHLKNQDV